MNDRPSRPSPRPHGRLAAPLLAALLLAGCGGSEVETEYGRRNSASLNGTAAFASMFQQAGFRVSTWKRFSPRLDQAQTLVWFTDEYSPPTAEQRLFVERWMERGSNRTLVFVARDYDASTRYWDQAASLAAPADWEEFRRRLARARADFHRQRAASGLETPARWFVMRQTPRRIRPASLAGPWAEGVDAARTDLELQLRLDPLTSGDQPKPAPPPAVGAPPLPTTVQADPVGGPPAPKPTPKTLPAPAEDETPENPQLVQAEPLLQTSDGDPIALRITAPDSNYPWPQWNDGQVIAVANGSFLLNAALVNPEHRKLAARLIQECGPPGRVVFLESSGVGGLPVLSQEAADEQNGLSLFRVWPLNAVLLHLIALGLLYCFARFPIFGRPRRLPVGSASDFGKHLFAVGELLERTRNAAYARHLLEIYHSGKTKESR